MKIGIIGAGLIGKTLARKFSATGHQVALADSKGPASLHTFASQTGVQAVDVADVATEAQVLIVAIPLRNIPNLANTLRGKLSEDVVLVETTNYWPHRDGAIEAIDKGMVNSVWVQQQFGRPVVKAFSNINAYSLAVEGKPQGSRDRIALAVASDDTNAKVVGMSLVNDAGFDALDAGILEDSWRQQPGSSAYCTDLTLPELAEARKSVRRELLIEKQQLSFRKINEVGGDYFNSLVSGNYPAGFVDHAVDIYRAINDLPPRKQ